MLKVQRRGDGRCWASTRGGSRCSCSAEGDLPYCQTHLSAGDGALLKKSHPLAELGSILVAGADLPQGYRMCFWGSRVPCPDIDTDDRTLQYKSGPRRTNPNGVIDPTGHSGSVLQLMNCHGVDELATVRTCSGPRAYFGGHNASGLVGVECRTTLSVSKGAQLAFNCKYRSLYLSSLHACIITCTLLLTLAFALGTDGAEWFRVRGLQRLDAGTENFPLPRKPARCCASAVATRAAASRLEARKSGQKERLAYLAPLLAPWLSSGESTLLELGCSVGGTGGAVLAAAASADLAGCHFLGVCPLRSASRLKAAIEEEKAAASDPHLTFVTSLAQVQDDSCDICLLGLIVVRKLLADVASTDGPHEILRQLCRVSTSTAAIVLEHDVAIDDGFEWLSSVVSGLGANDSWDVTVHMAPECDGGQDTPAPKLPPGVLKVIEDLIPVEVRSTLAEKGLSTRGSVPVLRARLVAAAADSRRPPPPPPLPSVIVIKRMVTTAGGPARDPSHISVEVKLSAFNIGVKPPKFLPILIIPREHWTGR